MEKTTEYWSINLIEIINFPQIHLDRIKSIHLLLVECSTLPIQVQGLWVIDYDSWIISTSRMLAIWSETRKIPVIEIYRRPFDGSSNQFRWRTTMVYPFHMTIFRYAITAVDDATYIFGGQTYDTDLNIKDLNLITKFNKNRKWSRIGTLLETRNSAGAITFGDETLIIGGRGSKAWVKLATGNPVIFWLRFYLGQKAGIQHERTKQSEWTQFYWISMNQFYSQFR